MKRHKSYKLGYDHTLIYDAVSHIGDATDASAAGMVMHVNRLHGRLAMNDNTRKELTTLIRFMENDQDVPKLNVTEGVITELHRNREETITNIINFGYELRKTRMAMKLKRANLSFEEDFFVLGNINAEKWYRTPDTMNIGKEIETALIKCEYDIYPDKWRMLVGYMNNPIKAHNNGLIAHAVVCTDKKRFDGVPFFFPITLRLDAKEDCVTGWFMDKHGICTMIPSDWRIFAYKPLERM